MLRAAHSDQAPLKKGTWTSEEDQKLTSYIENNGIWNWNSLPRAAGLLRSGKSCRLRWVNYLRPDLKHGNFNTEEVETIIKLQGVMGNRWSKIAARLPGRTDNEIKNFWNAHLKKRLKKSLVQTTDVFQGRIDSRRPKLSQDNCTDNIFHCVQKSSNPAETLESQLSIADLSSTSGSFIELDNIHSLDEQNIDFLEFSGDVQRLSEKPLTVDPTMSFCDGSVLLGNPIQFQDCIQQPCTSYKPTTSTLGPKCSGHPTANFSSAVEINQNSGLSTQLPSFWAMDGLTKVEDNAATLADQVWLDGSCSHHFPKDFASGDDFWVPTFM
ncbi:hypothetical protein K2173_004349 [Erythroxylum novogranatense]|uniref:Uncharacterized protein n=1 Tax=Erythroxylum novogranatense TaxID=1862640 RepID=A0AAV8T5U9_9ROSI|nr:hypothetical protein K2173_004349 [Erythroxylum novogranatense]